jgi:hypothetical protein
MNYCSASTTVADPYRAGAELGEKLQNLRPDVVIVFLTIHYADAVQDLVAGLRDFLGNEVLLCGGSGDGIYETSGAEAHGVSALGIHTDGESQWRAAFVRGVGADSAGATIEAARKVIAELDAPPTFVFALADGLKADGSQLVDGIASMLFCALLWRPNVGRSTIFAKRWSFSEMRQQRMHSCCWLLPGESPSGWTLQVAGYLLAISAAQHE